MSLTHSVTVMRMYRRALRECRNWNVSFVGYRENCLEVREMFDANNGETNPKELQRLVEEGQQELLKWKHPNPSIPPEYPGGTKYERNHPPPLHQCELSAEHYEWIYGKPKPADYDPHAPF